MNDGAWHQLAGRCFADFRICSLRKLLTRTPRRFIFVLSAAIVLLVTASVSAALGQEPDFKSILTTNPIPLTVISRGTSPIAQSIRISEKIPILIPMPQLDLKDRDQVEHFNRTYIAAATVSYGADFGGVAQVDSTGKVIAPGLVTPLALQVAHIRNYEFLKNLNVINPDPFNESAVEKALHAATAVADRPAVDIQALHELPNDGRFRSTEAVEGARQSALERGNGFRAGAIGYGGEHLDYLLQPMSRRGLATASVPGRSSATAFYLGGTPIGRDNYHDGIITTASGWTQRYMGSVERTSMIFSLPGVNARQLETQGQLDDQIRVYESYDGGAVFNRRMIRSLPNGSFTLSVSVYVRSTKPAIQPRKADYRVEWLNSSTAAWKTNTLFYGIFDPPTLERSLPLSKIANSEVDPERGVLKLNVIAQPGSHVSLKFRPSIAIGASGEQLLVYQQPLPCTPLEIPLIDLPAEGYFESTIEAFNSDRAPVIRALGWPDSRIVSNP